MHEKREALNAIELLKLFAVKQGLTINDIRDKKEATACHEILIEKDKAPDTTTIMPAGNNETSESVNKKSNDDGNCLVNI